MSIGIVSVIINTCALLWLCWYAFTQRERANKLSKLNSEILENNENLIKLNIELFNTLNESSYEEKSN